MPLVTLSNNHVAVQPVDQEVKALFEPYLRQAPFRVVQPENLHCSLLYADGSVPIELIEPERIYTGTITKAQVWWDSYLGVKDLVVCLDSPELVARHKALKEKAGVNNVYDDYFPHITLAYDIPNTNRRYRWWINDMLERFGTRYKGTVIRFSGEHVEDSAGNLPVRGPELVPVKPVL